MGLLYTQLLERLDKVVAERDAALADAQVEKTRADELNLEVERLSKTASKKIESLEKDLAQSISALHDARLENSGQAALLERKRPEPSRLEIAAMAMQGMLAASGYEVSRLASGALHYTDALIAAAKEGK